MHIIPLSHKKNIITKSLLAEKDEIESHHMSELIKLNYHILLDRECNSEDARFFSQLTTILIKRSFLLLNYTNVFYKTAK